MRHLIIFCLLTAYPVAYYAQETIVQPSPVVPDGQFGWAVAQFGDYAVVGAPNENFGQGAAYVFVRNGNTWTQQARLTANTPDNFGYFGWSVAIYDTYIAIGEYGSDTLGPNSGAVHVFQREGAGWNRQAKLVPSIRSQGAEFGISVSMSGGQLLVGAWKDWRSPDSAGVSIGFQTGAAYLFTRVDKEWNLYTRLTADDADRNDLFGQSVSIDGAQLAVGATSDGEQGRHSGAVYVFGLNTGTWVQQAKVHPDDARPRQHFGYAISLRDQHLAVGTPQDATHGKGSGATYVFARNGNTWNQQAKLFPPNPGFQQNAGRSISLNGDDLAIGTHRTNDMGEGSGIVHIYRRNGSNWPLQETFTASDGNSFDSFGHSIWLTNGRLLVGAYQKENGGSVYQVDY